MIMKNTLLMNFTVDRENKKIRVEREFAAPLAKVWAAWTDDKILDQWWAPKPWRTETKSMNFTVGGYWLYAMVGPDGTRHWARVDYQAIDPMKYYTAQDAFCDETGEVNTSFPINVWRNEFITSGESTLVHVTLSFDELSDLEKIIEMGFKEGFTMAMGNLDELLG